MKYLNITEELNNSGEVVTSPLADVELEVEDIETPEEEPELPADKGKDWSELYVSTEGKPLSPSTLRQLTHFRRRQDRGFVDVWWLYDDGGENNNLHVEYLGKLLYCGVG